MGKEWVVGGLWPGGHGPGPMSKVGSKVCPWFVKDLSRFTLSEQPVKDKTWSSFFLGTRNCPRFDLTANTVIYTHSILDILGWWTVIGQILDFKMHSICPSYVQVQGDQVFEVKMMKFNLCPGFVL